MEKYYPILNPILAFLVYEDAQNRQVNGGVAGYTTVTWAILVMVFGVFGLPTYLLARRRPRHEIRF